MCPNKNNTIQSNAVQYDNTNLYMMSTATVVALGGPGRHSGGLWQPEHANMFTNADD